jgi:hypothetical protein
VVKYFQKKYKIIVYLILKKTASNKVSNNNIIITKDLIFLFIEAQLDSNDIGIIIVVNNTKYLDHPSTPK